VTRVWTFVKAVGWWWLGALLNVSGVAQEVGRRAYPKWDGVMPFWLLMLAGSLVIFVGMFRAYAKVCDDLAAAVGDLAAVRGRPPLDVLVRPDRAVLLTGVPDRYLPGRTESAVWLGLSVTNRGNANANIELAIRVTFPGPSGQVMESTVSYRPLRAAVAPFTNPPDFLPSPLHLGSGGNTVQGEIFVVLDMLQSHLAGRDGAAFSLVVVDLVSDESVEVPIKVSDAISWPSNVEPTDA
jgi:hypothetical protein